MTHYETHGGVDWKLEFRHDKPQDVGEDGRRICQAFLKRRKKGGEWETYHVQQAACSPQDLYVREVGRQVALKRMWKSLRALREMFREHDGHENEVAEVSDVLTIYGNLVNKYFKRTRRGKAARAA